jgi:hypothetical protein
MAAGDAVVGLVTVALGTTSYQSIQPVSGVEWVIHNLYYDGGLEIQIYNGSVFVPFDSDTGAGSRMGMSTHVTNGQYIRIRNTSASVAVNVFYDGIQTK